MRTEDVPASVSNNVPLAVKLHRSEEQQRQDAADILRMMNDLEKEDPPGPDGSNVRQNVRSDRRETWANKVEGKSTRPKWPASAWTSKPMSEKIVASLGTDKISEKKPSQKGAGVLRDIINFIKSTWRKHEDHALYSERLDYENSVADRVS